MIKSIIIFLVILSYLNADTTKNSQNIYQNLESKSIDLYNSIKAKFETNQLTENEKRTEIKNKRFNDSWEKLFDEFKEGAELEKSLIKAPNSAWFSEDKEDIDGEINKVINRIVGILTGDNLLEYKDEIQFCKSNIAKIESKVITYRENKVGAPVSSSIHTTKSNYDEKIKDSKDEISIYKNKIEIIKDNLNMSFTDIGIKLDKKQINVLLSKIYGDDIIEMSLMMDVLNQITLQILNLMNENNEGLSEAQKYYGMNLISIKIQIFIQQKYIDKVSKNYIPKLDKIIESAENMQYESNRFLEDELNSKRKLVYKKNLEAQELTLKVANLYKEDLLNSQKNMLNAKKIAEENLKLANNTYQTVKLSSDLYNVMTESQKLFSEVMKIQMPVIIPFENTQVKQKYRELTSLLELDG